MGMNEDDYTYLCTDIDFIIHAAAYVNLVYPYEVKHILNSKFGYKINFFER